MRYGRFNLDRPNSDKETYIMLVYRHNSRRFKYSTGEKIHKDNWDAKEERPKHLNKRTKLATDNHAIYAQIERYKDFLNKCIMESKETGTELTNDLLKKKFDREFKIFDHTNNIVDSYTNWLDGRNQRNEVTHTTIKKYKTLRNNLIRFEQYKKNPAKFKSLKSNDKDVKDLPRLVLTFAFLPKFYSEYVAFARNILNLNNNTLSRSLTTMQAFIKWANKNGYTKFNDYHDWAKPGFESEIITLTRKELEMLIALDLTKNKRLEKVKDLFVLGCLTGGRFSDYTRITKADIFGDILRIRPIKTGNKVVNIPLHPVAKDILIKYNYQLPVISNQKFNKSIKDIARILNFNDEIRQINFIGKRRYEKIIPKMELISSHTARKTFVTLSLEAGMRQEVVMKISGHKSMSSFKRYVHVSDKMVENEAIKAWDFLNNKLKVVS